MKFIAIKKGSLLIIGCPQTTHEAVEEERSSRIKKVKSALAPTHLQHERDKPECCAQVFPNIRPCAN